MFRSNKLSVLEWIILLFVLGVPILNVVFTVWIFLKRKSSTTIKNFFIAGLILYLLAFIGMFSGTFNNVSCLFS